MTACLCFFVTLGRGILVSRVHFFDYWTYYLFQKVWLILSVLEIACGANFIQTVRGVCVKK